MNAAGNTRPPAAWINLSRGTDRGMAKSGTIGKKRAETLSASDGSAAASNDALLNLVRLLARPAARELLDQQNDSQG